MDVPLNGLISMLIEKDKYSESFDVSSNNEDNQNNRDDNAEESGSFSILGLNYRLRPISY